MKRLPWHIRGLRVLRHHPLKAAMQRCAQALRPLCGGVRAGGRNPSWPT
jgi:hypothetical protein